MKLAAVLFALLLQVASRGSIEGVVVRAGSEQPVAGAQVTLTRAGVAGGTSIRPVDTAADGKFRFDNLEAGSYALTVLGNGYARHILGQHYTGGPGSPIVLADGEASRGYSIRLIPAGNIEGYLRNSRGRPLPGIAVQLVRQVFNETGRRVLNSVATARSDDRGLEGRAIATGDWQRILVRMSAPASPGFTSAQVSATSDPGWGSLAFKDVATGEYRISITGLPQGFYVKQARFGGRDALNGTFRISDPEINSLDIVISSNVGAVSGTVRNERGDSLEGATVVLVPEHRDRTELFVRALSDRNGQFGFVNVPPGNYKAFAWDAIQLYSWFDSEVLKPVEARGTAIRLAESSSQQVNLTAIP